MPRFFPRWTLLLALIPAAWLGLWANDGDETYVLQAFQPENSFVVTPGETRSLRANIRRTDGSGVPGVNIIFGAPTEGPSGTFEGATGPSGSFIRVQTDAAGAASVMLTTNQIEGVFEVGIAVEGLPGFNQFSFTNTSSIPTTPASPQEIRDTVLEQRLSNTTLGPDVQLHGPVFVRAGSIIKAPAPPDPVSQDHPIAVERDSWFMWIDEAPTGFFAHEAQWILMDASLNAAAAVDEAVIYPVRWYPIVVPPSLDAEWTLFFPAGSHPESFNPDLFVDAVPPGLGVAQNVQQDAASEPCIIAIHGPGLRGSAYDIRRYINTFTSIGGVPSNRVFTNGRNDQVNVGAGANQVGYEHVSTADITRLVERAAAVPCSKVYFLMSSHGLDSNQRGSTGNQPGGGVLTQDRGRANPLSFDELANILKRLKPAGGMPVDLCLFQNACYAGQMKEWIQGLGLGGSFVSPADSDHMAWEDPSGRGSIYLSLYLAAKRDMLADADGDGKVSDREAMEFISTNVAPSTQQFAGGDSVERIFDPNPTFCPIFADTFRRIAADNVYVAGPGEPGSICIRRPASMPMDARYTGRVLIIRDGVAVDERFTKPEREEGVRAHRIEFTMEAGRREIKLPVQGVGCGLTRFEVAGRVTGSSAMGENQRTYIGEGVIQSSHFTVVCPNGPKVADVLGRPIDPPVSEITIEMGQTKTLLLKFHGRDFDSSTPATRPIFVQGRAATIRTSSGNRNIATISPEEAMKGGLEKEVEVMVTGEMVGMTTVRLRLRPADQNIANARPTAKEVKVNVIAPSTNSGGAMFIDPSGELVTPTYGIVTRTRDVENHISVVGRLPNMFMNRVKIYGPQQEAQQGADSMRQMSITMGARPHFVDLMGLINIEDGTFELGGSGPIPPFSSVPARAVGRIPIPAGSPTGVAQASSGFTMTYTLGEGVFPGRPTIYDIAMTPVDEGGDCTYQVDVDPSPAPFIGAFRSAIVRTGQGCDWTATSSADWLLIEDSEGAVTGTGPASLHLTVLNNSGGTERGALLNVQDAQAAITQDGASATRPVITGVSNGASFLSGVTAGSWITISGLKLAQTTRTWGDADFIAGALPRLLDGVSVTVNGAPGYPFFISSGQLNVLVDDALAPDQPADIVVSNAQGTSEPFRTVALPVDPALFLFDADSRRYAAAVHADGTFLGRPGLFAGLTTRSASGGDTVLFFGAGFGATEPPQAAGLLVQQPATLARPVIFRIGRREARVVFAGLVSSGLYQFNVEIPFGLEPGDHVLEAYLDGVPIQTGVHITVE